jgi:hypothetical protein
MQPRRSRIVVLAGVTLTIILAACENTPSKNLGPTQPVWQAVANHIDSLFTNLTSYPDTFSNTPDSIAVATIMHQDSAVAESLAYAETPPSMGGLVSPVTVTTASGTQTWQGLTFEVAATGTGGDSEFVTAIYSDTGFSTLVVAETFYSGGGSPTGTAYIVQDTTYPGFASTTYTGAGAVNSTGSAASCSVIGGINAYPVITNYVSSIAGVGIGTTTCQPATFTISFSATFPDNANLGALSSVAIAGTSFTGVRNYAALSAGSHIAATIAARLKRIGAR